MSEDRLEKALEGMRDENVTPEQLAGARTRVWEKLGSPSLSVCAEFEPGFGAYLEGRLNENRRLLTEDHLSRCTHCRAQLAALRGEQKAIPLPPHKISRWFRAAAWAGAAAMIMVALYLGRDRIDSLLAPSGPRATVASVSGALYRVPTGALLPGSAIADGETVRTGPGARAVLRLADGSLVDVNERTELFVRAAWSGQSVHLQRGDVIVQAAKQRRGHLRVQTRDSLASVKGTVFAVSAGLGGTVVSVVEGSVSVTQPSGEVVLRPGEQAASNPALALSVQDAVSWSPDAENYAALLASFAKIEKEIAGLPAPAPRTGSHLVQFLPSNTVLYGAVPNPGGTIAQAVVLAEQQSAENPVFRDWWNSGTGQELKRLIDRIQTVTPLLGDEIVFGFVAGASGANDQIPMVMAELQPGKATELAAALDALRNEAGGIPLPYTLADNLMVASDSQPHLQWVVEHLGEGASTPFAEAIAARYSRGAGWLLGMDIGPALPAAPGVAEAELTGARQMRHLFVEQRNVRGAEENEVTLTFNGPRMGMASWLASAGSGGAAEYISADAVCALYASTREPKQLFDELTAQFASSGSSDAEGFAAVESKLGPGFAGALAASFGTESAFALEGFAVTGPVWVLAALVNDPATVDGSVQRLVEVFNAELAPENRARQIVLTQETVDGRRWTTMKTGLSPLSATWTYDGGYLVAASDRAAAQRAIATRNGGSPLVWSAAFQQQLPSSAALHPSAFAWLNTKGVFQDFAALVSNPTLQRLLAERDPILVAFNGTTEQIHAASRTRISGLIVDAMLLEGLGRGGTASPAAILQGARPGTR